MAKQKKSSTKKLLIFGICLIVVFGIGAALANAFGWIGGQEEGIAVETSPAKLKTITQLVSASGQIQPEVEVVIRPEVSGQIIELPVKEGDYVEEGDLLLRIKPDIYQARIDEIKAAVLTQKARKEQAHANLLLAESEYNQKKKLYETGAVSEAEFIQAKTNYEAQKASLQAAEYQVQSVQAQLEQAQEELQKTIIRAPRSGTISKLSVEEGERILGNTMSIGTELMRIAKMNQLEVLVSVNENDIVSVSVGDTANIEVDAYPERIFKGIVTEIANSATVTGAGTNEQVTNYEVKIRIATPHNLEMAGNQQMVQKIMEENPEIEFAPSFKPGMSATVDVETETAFNVVSVPIQAVTVRDFANVETDSAGTDSASVDADLIIPEEDLRKVVFVVENGKAVRTEVETGISDNMHIQILSGISAGDEIVIGSYRVLSQELEDGDKVKVSNNKFNSFVASN
ncbi:MAG TPA: efflux RND transporter periplasmic adaptor subunit [Balneolaceae bacterium]